MPSLTSEPPSTKSTLVPSGSEPGVAAVGVGRRAGAGAVRGVADVRRAGAVGEDEVRGALGAVGVHLRAGWILAVSAGAYVGAAAFAVRGFATAAGSGAHQGRGDGGGGDQGQGRGQGSCCAHGRSSLPLVIQDTVPTSRPNETGGQ